MIIDTTRILAGLLLWARRVGDIDRLLHGRRCSSTAPQHGEQQQIAGSATFTAEEYIAAEHTLVFIIITVIMVTHPCTVCALLSVNNDITGVLQNVRAVNTL